MAGEDMDIFVICPKDDIAPGQARAFSLFRHDETGGSRPFRIVVLRTPDDDFAAYVNTCPHQASWLNIGDGEFLTPDRRHLRCGRHGATFDIGSGLCLSGPCQGESLEPVALAAIGADLCLVGVNLVEENPALSRLDDDDDETMEIMIHPG